MNFQALIISISSLLASVFLVAQTPLDNGNLDNWVNHSTYQDPAGSMFKTLNSLSFFGVPVTVFKTSDAKSNYAAQLKSNTYVVLNIFIPGTLGTIVAQISPPAAFLGVPFTDMPSRFKGWYKYQPVGNDSAEILIALMKRNGPSRDTVARAVMKIKNAVNAYTQFDLPLTYFSTTVPDSLIILCVSSAGYNFQNLFACAGQNNSTLYVDELELEYSTGLSESYPLPELRVYPNPATEQIWVEGPAASAGAVLELNDSEGRLVRRLLFSSWPLLLPIESLPAGRYFLRLVEGLRITARGTFMK
ncbi:MAG: PCMD domain-containing protein [Flavobacteriales bacterium]|nr:PCMD domain-containing protein [Flavobacteriales bacterium]MDW8409945.1 PCMD domain-containing protein [Flavobacteriales bacterium]